MRVSLFLALLFICVRAYAAEGMWTLDKLPSSNIEPKHKLVVADPRWIERAMHASVRLTNGCSGSFVSTDALVLTNHHCAVDCVEQLSTGDKNLVHDGFLASKREEEIRCPEIQLNRLEQITDVTAQVKAATAGLQGEAFKNAQNAVKATLASACVGKDKETIRCDVVDLYHGGLYHLYKYHRFQDVRLVWVPEQDAADFGGDPDNFNFPRYDLDAALLRAYEDGKPTSVKDYFPFARSGVEEGDATFITGHPGTTQRLLSVAQLETLRDVRLLRRLMRTAELRGVLSEYRKTGQEPARVAANDLFFLENSYKVLYGELQALLDPELLKRKRAEENALRKYVAANPGLSARVAGAWDAIAKAQAVYRDIEIEYYVKESSRGFYSKYFAYARALVRGAEERARPNTERLPEFSDSRLPEVEQDLFSTAPVYADLEKLKLAWALTKMREWLGADDPFVQQVLGKESPDQLATRLVAATKLGDPAVRKALWSGGKEAVAKSNDPFIQLARAIDPAARAIRKRYESEVEAVEQKNTELIAQARFARAGTSVYPDATFTLRLSYGEVKGWNERGRAVAPFTDFAGAFARNTGAEPFALPQSWLAAKDKLNLQQRFNFVTTNDIVGGNSGSPVVNSKGEIVGLAFDGNIHSLGGAFWFDERVNRTVAVHSGAILEALEKIYAADAIVQEIRGGTASGAN
jgi:hypothetical protein